MNKEYTKEQLCCIWLDSFLGLEYKHKIVILQKMYDKNSGRYLLDNAKEYIIDKVGQREYSTLSSSFNNTYFDYVLESLEKKNITAVTINSQFYPKVFEELPYPPFVLYAKGDLSLLNEQIFAIVGSRKNIPLSIKLAQNYTKALSEQGFVLATGIAEGVDKAVLETALSCGGKAISVIAGGFDHIYPASHKDLVEKIVDKGLVISEYPPDTVSKPFFFPVRNRIIAGISKGVLIVSGAKKSGTLYTAEYAEEYGKDLFAIPYSVDIQTGAGCNDLIKKGAILTDSPQDILDFYGIEQKQNDNAKLSEQERQVLSALKDGEKHVEKISEQIGKKAHEIMPILSVLEIKGLVARSGNVFGATGNYSEE